MNTKIEIGYKHILFAFGLIISLYLLALLRDVIMGLFVCFLIATALNPVVNRLEKLRFPRPAAILIIYALIIAAIVFLVSTIVPPLIAQTVTLIQSLPLNSVSRQLDLLEVNLENIQLISRQLGSVVPVFKFVGSTFSGLIAFFTFAVITYYLLLERKHLHKHIVNLVGNPKKEAQIEKFINKVEAQIGGWIRGELMLMFIVGVITYIGLRLLQIPYALPLAIIAGLLEIVPNIGPTISAIPAILVPLVLGQNPIMAVFVTALYILVQQLENNLITPRVMQTAAGVHPLVTIILIISGLRLAGIAGAILAVPTFLVAKVVFTELRSVFQAS